jgi:hypothetical protein
MSFLTSPRLRKKKKSRSARSPEFTLRWNHDPMFAEPSTELRLLRGIPVPAGTYWGA